MKKIILILLFLITLFIIAELTGLRDNFTISYIQSLFLNNIVISSILFCILFSIANLLQIPGWIFLVAAISSLGKLHGAGLTYLAANLSCMVSYLIVGYLGENALRKVDNRFITKTLNNLDKHPIRSMFILRVVFQTFPPINYTLALSDVKMRDYIIACLIGLPIPIITLTTFFELIFKRFL